MGKGKATLKDIELLAEASDNISLSDTVDQQIKSETDWSLLPNKGLTSCVAPSILVGKFLSYSKFPELLINQHVFLHFD